MKPKLSYMYVNRIFGLVELIKSPIGMIKAGRNCVVNPHWPRIIEKDLFFGTIKNKLK